MILVGCDEAGRGPILGSVVVAAVAVPEDWELEGVTDSKLMKPHRRAELEPEICEQASHWVVAQSSAQQIDQFGINNCVLCLMRVCVARCLERFPDATVIVDGDQPIPGIDRSKQRVVAKADQKYQSVGAASIIAKVFRDRQVIRFAAEYMEYDLHNSKGYGTRIHLQQVLRHGLTPWHRRSFDPIKRWINEGKIQV